MNVEYGNVWDAPWDVLCVTTNGTVLRNGENIMGAGIAGEAARRHAWLPRVHGQLLREHGVNVYLLPCKLVMFPTKPSIDRPASMSLIEESCRTLMWMADLYQWGNVALPAPGAGLGGLEWDDVRDAIDPIIDNRVTIWRYAKEAVK